MNLRFRIFVLALLIAWLIPSPAEILPAAGQGQVINPTGAGLAVSRAAVTSTSGGQSTGATTFASTGWGIAFTPQRTGTSVFLVATAAASNSTLADGCGISIYQNATAIPGINVGVGTDTQVGSFAASISTAANNVYGHPSIGLVSGLTQGTTVYFYVAYEAITGGACVLASATNQVRLVAIEY